MTNCAAQPTSPRLGMHRYHFFTNRYDTDTFICVLADTEYRYRYFLDLVSMKEVQLKAVFISSSEDYVKPLVRLYKMNRRLFQAKNKQSFLV